MRSLRFDPDQCFSTVYTTKAKPAPITKKTKPKIIIFIEVEIVDRVKEFVCSVIVRLVGTIKFSVLATTSQFYGVG